MTNSIILYLPILPDLDLSSNRRRSRHWGAQARDTKSERERAYAMLLKAKPQVNEDVEATDRFWRVLKDNKRFDLAWTVYFPKGQRSLDSNGLAPILKVWEDVLVKPLRWLVNDSPRYVRRVSYESVASSPRGPGMELRIEAVV